MIGRIIIMDFGSQVTELIARLIRKSGVYCELFPFNVDLNLIKNFSASGVILSGGPYSVYDKNAPQVPNLVFEMNVPILGICYGAQLLCHQLGGIVEQSEKQEFGRTEITIKDSCLLFNKLLPLGRVETVWMSHKDRITAIPPGFKSVATTPSSPFASFANEQKRIYGLLFHPEVEHTPCGNQLLRNFTYKVVGLTSSWNVASYKDQVISKIRKQVGNSKVLCGLSGGIDSLVTALLIHKAIGDQLTCIFVDNGLMRSGEAKEFNRLFRRQYNIPLITRDASEEFLNELEGIDDPEIKRKTIGELFINIFDSEASKIEGAKFLAQGTLYTDVIESLSKTNSPLITIKSHHNVGGLPNVMKMQLVEPLRELFKDEVRALGRELGIPDSLINRHPFPGPGLAIRLIGSVTREKLNILTSADAIYLDEIRKAGLYDEIWQAFVVLLPIRTVGVMGDSRTYDYVCVLRAVTASNGMTADYYKFPHEFLSRTATRIVNEVRGINRVTYDVTSKPPSTIEWE
ncbi:GMP synthase, N-terminal domain protein [Candidatus Endolissoclinum faulkneri L2]|uniref:GMP synthase [glutamine-hydrolyzing] n=1 Tax=Candidatus Endolissoclinum faulkneri L2 TaxID=1193729 RepID=K7YNV0_9PROT|nr:glutamine-hydrolyzing GMP synthase [Candidatus Endolissoclinum faulkneri]AFX99222.1 GMP synthase, N-terminal domain protein [Candidatus Endolissoclinum faulkneri L2]